MTSTSEFKPKSGYVYVVTNECLKQVNAKGVFRGKKVRAVKIGNAKDFTNRLGSLNTAVYENFDFHLGIKTDDVVGLEGLIHTALQDYRIYTRDGNKTEFFACPLDEVIRRIKKLIARGHKENVEEYKGGKVIGRHGAGIRANIERQQLDRAKAKARTAVKARCVRESGRQQGKASAFSFASTGISVGSDLVFMPTGAVVKVVDGKNKISYPCGGEIQWVYSRIHLRLLQRKRNLPDRNADQEQSSVFQRFDCIPHCDIAATVSCIFKRKDRRARDWVPLRDCKHNANVS